MLGSLISGSNKVRAFNSWALLAYTFGIVRWTQIKLNSVDRQIRKLLTAFVFNETVLYIPRKCRARSCMVDPMEP